MLFPMHYGSTNAFMKCPTAEIKAFLYMCNNMKILPELGATLQYNLGTVIQFCGILLMHLVSGWDKGYRVCHASFFRKDVFERLEVELFNWSTENNLKELGLNPLDL
jgi:hypothetical protein